jgi:hypothetical protein
MALIRKPIDKFSTEPLWNKEFQWSEPAVDDLFESFVNSDSFNLSNNETERIFTTDPVSYFNTRESASGCDTIDTFPMPDVDAPHMKLEAEPWHRAALSFVEEHTASPILNVEQRRSSVYSQAGGGSAASTSDLLRHQRAATSIPLELAKSLPPSPPGWDFEETKSPFDAALVVRSNPRGPSNCDEPSAHRGSASPKMMSSRQAVWTRHPQTTSENGQLTLRIPPLHRASSRPPSGQMKFETFGYNCEEDQPMRSPSGFQEDTQPLSPISNGNRFCYFQPPNTPVALRTSEESRTSSFTEPQPSSQLSSYPSTPYAVHAEHTNFLLTPPHTQPMMNGQWTHDASLAVLSPDFAQLDKAEAWWEPSAQHADPSEVTCGAPAASSMLGLGISDIHESNMASVTSNGVGIIQPFAVSHGAAPTLASSPTPRMLSNRGGRTHFSASSSANPASMYPMSPLQDHAQVRQSQHMQQHDSRYRHHQRHHTVPAPISSSLDTISQPDYHERTASASPPPTVRPHRRTKSSSNSRRKSSTVSPRQTSAGFVNYTPDDSRKILTGVAPSGSSKTKARREKEAADKRRKLGEAAKKAVLEAGGDLGTLEREGLLVLGSEL